MRGGVDILVAARARVCVYVRGWIFYYYYEQDFTVSGELFEFVV